MAAIFGPAANIASKLTLLTVGGIAVAGWAAWCWWPRTDYARHVRAVVPQPVLSVISITSRPWARLSVMSRLVETSSNAGLPPTPPA